MNVLDMADPAHPALTDRLVTPAMDTRTSRSSSARAAACWPRWPATSPRTSARSTSTTCRRTAATPSFRSTTPVGVLGHESGLSPDGKTFYSASPTGQTIVAVDISNPTLPKPIWFGHYDSHGLSISADGNRAYVAGINSGLIILDTTEVQARALTRQVTEVARLQWHSMSIPQNAIPITHQGAPVPRGDRRVRRPVAGRRRPDHRHRRRGAPEGHLEPAARGPPEGELRRAEGRQRRENPVQGYAGHYCNVPTRVDPAIVACSMILSGLRVFDIRDPYHPREIAYFNAPVTPRIIPPGGVNPPPATGRCRARRSSRARARSGTRTGSAASTRCGSRTAAARIARREQAACGRCLARRSPIGPRNIGRVRLGFTRNRLRALPRSAGRTTRRSSATA